MEKVGEMGGEMGGLKGRPRNAGGFIEVSRMTRS